MSVTSSKYQFVAGELMRRIESGELTGALPGVKQLAIEYNVNFMTVDKAIRQLKEMEVVTRIPRKGTYVCKQKTVAICVSDPNPLFLQLGFYAPFIGAVQNYLGRRNCLLLSENLHGKNDLYLRNLLRRIDGVILMSKILDDMPEALQGVRKVLAMGVVDPAGGSDHITYHQEKVGILAADYLAARGCNHVAYIGSDAPGIYRVRCNSFLHHAGERGLRTTSISARSYPDRVNWLERLEEFLRLPDRPTGIFCPTDDDAVFTGNWLWGRGLLPGRDVHIIGCNNEEQIRRLALGAPPATIDLRLEDIGIAAAEQLSLRVDGLPDERCVKVFEPMLITPGAETKIANSI